MSLRGHSIEQSASLPDGRIVAGLESGELEPTAAGIEPLADEPR